MLTHDEVVWGYRYLLGRDPESAEVVALQAVQYADWPEFRAALLGSSEYAARGIQEQAVNRLLLFGAYGNGNFGDDIQAWSLRNHILRLTGCFEPWATTTFQQDFPFPADRIAPHSTIHSVAELEKFDAVLIGGGGLLACPHWPLNDHQWMSTLTRPIALLALGATSAVADNAVELIRKAVFVSARDKESHQALSRHTSGVVDMPDPVLVDSSLPIPQSVDQKWKTCWILRGPPGSLHDEVRERIEPSDIVVCVEPLIDKELEAVFANVYFTRDLKELLGFIAASERVVSMRFHGAILGLRCGKPTYGLEVRKTRLLLEELGVPEAFAYTPIKLDFSTPYRLDLVSEVIRKKAQMFDWAMVTALLKLAMR